uniref:Uncharacterized protein n=1 Tax=Rhizophora mucronata TaxID=61149 RepID=A0A2P2QKT5_RHIMU
MSLEQLLFSCAHGHEQELLCGMICEELWMEIML